MNRAVLGITRESLKRVGGFGVTVLANTAVGLVTMPVLIFGVGSKQWGYLALAQSVALLIAVIVSFGWGATGPTTIALMNSSQRREFYLESFFARGGLYLVSVPIMTALLGVLLHGQWTFSLMAALSLLLPSVGASWFFIGEGTPRRLFLVDALPQMVGSLVGAVSTLLTHALMSFMVIQFVGNLGAVISALTLIVLRRRAEDNHASDAQGIASHVSLRSVLCALGRQRDGVLATFTTSLYVTLPSMLVQWFLPSALSTYAFGERLYRYASVAYSPIQQFLQSWVPGGGDCQLRSRARKATAVAGGIGALGGVTIFTLSDFASLLLTHGEIQIDVSMKLAFSMAFLSVAVSGTVGLACLVALRRVKALSLSSGLGALVGVPVMVLSATVAQSADGVAWAVALAESIVSAVQLVTLWSSLRSVRC